MKTDKPNLSSIFSDIAPDPRDDATRQLALEYIAAAWNEAEEDGVGSDALAHASLFAALTTLVNSFGDEAAAVLIATLPDRIRAGEYNLDRSLQ